MSTMKVHFVDAEECDDYSELIDIARRIELAVTPDVNDFSYKRTGVSLVFSDPKLMGCVGFPKYELTDDDRMLVDGSIALLRKFGVIKTITKFIIAPHMYRINNAQNAKLIGSDSHIDSPLTGEDTLTTIFYTTRYDSETLLGGDLSVYDRSAEQMLIKEQTGRITILPGCVRHRATPISGDGWRCKVFVMIYGPESLVED